ncbi:acetyl-CoA synthetase-like protein [Trametes cingulata]|nr:acetyl-CoA synthetase-like protein [Trametes cingulata]
MDQHDGKLAIRTQQGIHSSTWTRPPFYGDMTVPELFAFHAEKSPEHPVIVYDDEHGVIHTLCYKEMSIAIRRAAHYLSSRLDGRASPVGTDGSRNPPVVGILANIDNITFTALLVGVMYLGYTPFPISVRNSSLAVAHLVRMTCVHSLLVSQDASMQRVAQEVQQQLAKEGYEVSLLEVPTFEDIYNGNETCDIDIGPVGADKPAIILHSSGSTSFPKPIMPTHRDMTRWGFLAYFGDMDVCGLRCSMQSLPMFHMMGVIGIPWVLCTGAVVAQFRPSSPPVVTTPDILLRAIAATQCVIVVCVPSIVEAWAGEPRSIPVLRGLKVLHYAGAPLNKEVGEYLIDQGVPLVTGYGMTEIGAVRSIMPDPTRINRSEWEYFSFGQPVDFVRVYQAGLSRVFELVIVDCPSWSPYVFNTEVDGRRAYATSDLFEEHPTNSDLYRMYGRADDQIMLSTGEKTNPVPMEARLVQDPNVRAAIIFGRGRLQNGVLIQPSEPFDPEDEVMLEEFRGKIWPTVEQINKFAPSHSRIFKEMITVTRPDKPFQLTAKGTPRRHVCLADYAEEIDELYRKVDESSQAGVQHPLVWTDDDIREYVRSVVQMVLRAPKIADEDDLFQQGCDSLQATWIRNTILRAVRTKTSVSTHTVPPNFVYANPTIAQLSAFLRELPLGRSTDTEAERAARLAEMEGLVQRYSANCPEPRWASSVHPLKDFEDSPPTAMSAVRFTAKEIVLITGTTGWFGSHILAQLLQIPEVVRVYALNRGSPGANAVLETRQREAFKKWGLSEDLMSEKVSFLPADLTATGFALDETTFAELRDSVTTVVHNAWRVDFNITLASFEPLIAGTRNLLGFALSSRLPGGPRFLFVSSIASVHNHPRGIPVPETLDLGPECAVGQGYGESKWVTEQIIRRISNETGLRTTVVRVGQLSGDTRIGGWNTTEWVPGIVRAGRWLNCVPSADDCVSWVPVDVAASALLEMVHNGGRVFHLSSPRPAPWNTVFAVFARELGVPLLPGPEWLSKLRESALATGTPTFHAMHDPAHNLLPFFQELTAIKQPDFDTSNAVQASNTLARLGPVTDEDARRWLRFWKRLGFLDL